MKRSTLIRLGKLGAPIDASSEWKREADHARRHELFSRSRVPGLSDPEKAELVELDRRISAFPIDTEVAKALRDDQERLNELVQKRYAPGGYGGPLGASEVEAESELRASIADRAKAIGCPVGYGPRQARNDSNRLHQIHCKRRSPSSCGGGELTAAEDAEEAQLTARIAAFEESPEGHARSRILELELQEYSKGRSAAEQNELDRLRALYPDPPADPDDPLYDAHEAFASDGLPARRHRLVP